MGWASSAERMSQRSGIFRKTCSEGNMIATPRCVLCMQHAFFWPPSPYPVLNSSHTICLYARSVLFCWILIGSDSILRGGWGRGAEKNRAIKRFRNRAISNRDFISISINRTALLDNNNINIISWYAVNKPNPISVRFPIFIWKVITASLSLPKASSQSAVCTDSLTDLHQNWPDPPSPPQSSTLPKYSASWGHLWKPKTQLTVS